MLEQLSPSRALGELAWGDTWWIGNTRGCFERQLTCGVCGQNNLKIKNLRRGRSASGCNHFPETCPAYGLMSLAWAAFSFENLLALTGDRAAGVAGHDAEWGRHANRAGYIVGVE